MFGFFDLVGCWDLLFVFVMVGVIGVVVFVFVWVKCWICFWFGLLM